MKKAEGVVQESVANIQNKAAPIVREAPSIMINRYLSCQVPTSIHCIWSAGVVLLLLGSRRKMSCLEMLR